MRLCKLAFVLYAAVISSAFVFPEAFAAATAHDPCKVLTVEKFSQIMGYKATLDKTGSNQTSCFYQGPADSGGQFTILTETASGPQADAMLQGPGSAPPPDSGMIGGTYKQGSVIFSVSIRSTDHAKLQALAAEIKRNLQ
jgi:hypothetical protein